MKCFGAAATHLSPGQHPDSKQPLVVIIIIKIILYQPKSHSMKCTEDRNEKRKEKTQAFTASMKTHIQLQPDASATILLTCPLPLGRGVLSPFWFCSEGNGLFTNLLSKVIAAEAPLTPAAASIQRKTPVRGGHSKVRAMDLASPEEIIQSFFPCTDYNPGTCVPEQQTP